MSPDCLARCMGALAEQAPHPPMTDARMKLYRRFLMDLDDAEIERAVGVHLTEGDARFFPTIAQLRLLARPLPTDVELGPVFRGIEGASRYDPIDGPTWSARDVERQYGPAAREAFVAIGGSAVFARLDFGDNRPHAMRRFYEAYREAARLGARDQLGLTTPAPMRALVSATAAKLSAGPQPTTAQLRAKWFAGKPD